MRVSLVILPLLAACAADPKPVADVRAAHQPLTPLEPAIRFSMSQQAFDVAHAMVGECLSQDVMKSFADRQGRQPVIKVIPSTVLSGGAIDPLMLEKLVEAELVGSGKAQVISAASVSDRGEPGDLVVQVPRGSLRPDFILTVSVAADPSQVVVTTLELVRLKTNEKVWMKVHRTSVKEREVRPA